MKKWLFWLALASSISVQTPALANAADAIAIDDMTISWPDDDWYQVQIVPSYQSVCNGGRSCTVPMAGTYQVINHTTGERLPLLVVTGDSADPEPEPGVIVNGNTISWPDDGWYQVQEIPSYNSICEGSKNCTVPAVGTYKVINHSTSDRRSVIVVVGSGIGITVNDNTLSWPDDGWYQVQDPNTFHSFCEGELSCVVPDGVYTVINHTTSQRFEGIMVGDGTPHLPSAINRDNYIDILTQAFEIYLGTSYDRRMPTDSMSNLLIGNYTETRVPRDYQVDVSRVYYCPNGGTITKDFILGIAPNISNTYTLDNCSHYSDVLNGEFHLGGYRESSQYLIYLTAYSAQIQPDGQLSIDGAYRRSNSEALHYASPYSYLRQWQAQELDYSAHYSGQSLVVQNATTSVSYGYTDRRSNPRYIPAEAGDKEYLWNYQAKLSGDFIFNSSAQNDVPMTASTPVEFAYSSVHNLDALQPYQTGVPALRYFTRGQLLIETSDDNSVQLNADTGNVETVRITIKSKDGFESFDQDWAVWHDALRIRQIKTNDKPCNGLEYPVSNQACNL